MKKEKIISYLFIATLISVAMPLDLLATTDTFYTALNDQAETVQNIAMGPALKIVGVLGVAMGIGLSYVKHSPMPFVTCGAIGLISGTLGPKLIEKFYTVSSMLLP